MGVLQQWDVFWCNAENYTAVEVRITFPDLTVTSQNCSSSVNKNASSKNFFVITSDIKAIMEKKNMLRKRAFSFMK